MLTSTRFATRNLVTNMNVNYKFPKKTLTDISATELSCEDSIMAKARRQPFPAAPKVKS